MDYVMVPVPEEFVAEVEQYVRVTSAKRQGTLDPQVAQRLLSSFDAPTRTLLLSAAAAAAEGSGFALRDAAAAAGCTEHEVLGRSVVINNAVVAEGGPPFTVVPMLKGVSTTGPLVMERELGRIFLAAARALDRTPD
jgi:hypothetical protein